jgi:hypothetical protein
MRKEAGGRYSTLHDDPSSSRASARRRLHYKRIKEKEIYNMPRYMVDLVLFAGQYIQDRAAEFDAVRVKRFYQKIISMLMR